MVERIIELLKSGQRVANQSWTPKEVEVINSMFLLTAKPSIYLINLSERDYIRKKNKHLLKIKEWVDKYSPGDLIIPFSVCLEERLSHMSEEEAQEELKNFGCPICPSKDHHDHEREVRFDLFLHLWSR